MKKQKIKLIILYICSFIVSIAPLLTVFIVNWDKYTDTPGNTIKICIGGVICLIMLFLKVVGKLKMPRRIVSFGIVFILVYLLKSLLDDILLLSGMALAGELIDYIFFQRAIKTTKENLVAEKTADMTSEKIEAVIKKYIGRT